MTQTIITERDIYAIINSTDYCADGKAYIHTGSAQDLYDLGVEEDDIAGMEIGEARITDPFGAMVIRLS